MVNLKDLKNKNEEKKIREILTVGEDSVKIYEPTQANIERILDFQEEAMIQKEDGTYSVEIDGADLVKELFPLLTDIQGIQEMTSEEIAEVVEEPSLLFIQVQQVIANILHEVYKTVVLSTRTKLSELSLELSSKAVEDNIISKSLEDASKKSAKIVEFDKIRQQISEIEDMVEKENVVEKTQREESTMNILFGEEDLDLTEIEEISE